MATTTDPIVRADRGPFVAPADELQSLRRAAQALSQSESDPPTLKTANGEEIELSPTLLRVLRLVAETLAADRAVVLGSLGKLITPHEAATLLKLPITHLVRLLDDGSLSFTQVGDVRLLSLEEVLAYRRVQAGRSQEALDELTRLGQEWGLNDIDYSTIKVRRLTEREENL